MAKYLIKATYSAEGAKGVLKEGGTGRKDVVSRAVGELGGKLESFYFAFGEHDAYVTCDMPDNVSAAAVSLAVNAAGGAKTTTVVLMTPEEVDQATKKGVSAYRPPGG
jgi:uncharacterized protein with GYD domain